MIIPRAIALALTLAGAAEARPVSHPGGTTVLTELNPMLASAHVHYSPNRHWSFGPRILYNREQQATYAGMQATWLARRWNMPAAQANLYVAGMAAAVNRKGGQHHPGGSSQDSIGAGGFAEVQADWENRRLMVMGMARLTHAEGLGTSSMQMGRIGWAPYQGGYGDIHLWLFGQVRHDSTMHDRLEPALVARIFYRTLLLEAGITDRGGVILNSTIRF